MAVARETLRTDIKRPLGLGCCAGRPNRRRGAGLRSARRHWWRVRWLGLSRSHLLVLDALAFILAAAVRAMTWVDAAAGGDGLGGDQAALDGRRAGERSDGFGMQGDERLAVLPLEVTILASSGGADPGLRFAEAVGDLHLRQAGCLNFSEECFPIHGEHYQNPIRQCQQQPDCRFKHNPDMKKLSDRLREERNSHGWSQPELARVSKVKQAFIGALEAENQQNSGWLPELAHALGVDAYWLKTGKGDKHGKGRKLNTDEELLLQALPLISDDLRESWLNAAKKAVDRSNDSQAKAA